MTPLLPQPGLACGVHGREDGRVDPVRDHRRSDSPVHALRVDLPPEVGHEHEAVHLLDHPVVLVRVGLRVHGKPVHPSKSVIVLRDGREHPQIAEGHEHVWLEGAAPLEPAPVENVGARLHPVAHGESQVAVSHVHGPIVPEPEADDLVVGVGREGLAEHVVLPPEAGGGVNVIGAGDDPSLAHRRSAPLRVSSRISAACPHVQPARGSGFGRFS